MENVTWISPEAKARSERIARAERVSTWVDSELKKAEERKPEPVIIITKLDPETKEKADRKAALLLDELRLINILSQPIVNDP